MYLPHCGIGSLGHHTAMDASLSLSMQVRIIELAGRRSPLQEYSIVCVAKNCTEISTGFVIEKRSAEGGSSQTKQLRSTFWKKLISCILLL